MTENQIRDFVDHKKEIMRQMLMEEIMDDLSTGEIRMLYAFIALNPKSSQYGDMLGAFSYKDTVCVFRFHVHRPKQKFPSLSNRMTDCRMIYTKERFGLVHYEEDENCPYLKAFWQNTPDSRLDENSLAIRQFVENITDYSRRKDFCGQLRKNR